MPVLIHVLMPIVIILAIIVVIPMVLFRSAAGCLTGVLGMLLPRGRRAPSATSELSFRIRTPEGARRDVVLKGSRSGLQLGDDVTITALPGRGPVEALVVVNRSSPGAYRRQGLTIAILAACFLLVTAASIISAWITR